MTTAQEPRDAAEALVARLRAGDALALSRAITAVENGSTLLPSILRAIHPHLGRATVVGVTGPPGVGKSTLVNAYVRELRRRGLTVGVVAVDPSSPISGGAILGDRVRMSEHDADEGVFVRSLASRGQLGGLAARTLHIVDLMDAAGRDAVIVETVGAGQSEVEIAGIAGVTVVVSAPGLGDDIQAIKAGILEIADVLVVNKADLPGAAETRRQLESMLALRSGARAKVPVLATVATTGEGVPELADAIEARSEAGGARRREAGVRHLLADAAANLLRRRLEAGGNPRLEALAGAVRRGEIGLRAAAEKLLAAEDDDAG